MTSNFFSLVLSATWQFRTSRRNWSVLEISNTLQKLFRSLEAAISLKAHSLCFLFSNQNFCIFHFAASTLLALLSLFILGLCRSGLLMWKVQQVLDIANISAITDGAFKLKQLNCR